VKDDVKQPRNYNKSPRFERVQVFHQDLTVRTKLARLEVGASSESPCSTTYLYHRGAPLHSFECLADAFHHQLYCDAIDRFARRRQVIENRLARVRLAAPIPS
jgi:hypothetical protein